MFDLHSSPSTIQCIGDKHTGTRTCRNVNRILSHGHVRTSFRCGLESYLCTSIGIRIPDTTSSGTSFSINQLKIEQGKLNEWYCCFPVGGKYENILYNRRTSIHLSIHLVNFSIFLLEYS
jgi:hypothetical protein